MYSILWPFLPQQSGTFDPEASSDLRIVSAGPINPDGVEDSAGDTFATIGAGATFVAGDIAATCNTIHAPLRMLARPATRACTGDDLRDEAGTVPNPFSNFTKILICHAGRKRRPSWKEEETFRFNLVTST